ncbi:MAG TPA: MOSC domain-containing protein [Steroidobacteraceae bacterium]|nr:MOSC domain-containing protein [Steroidobacteraceae bacterium]
MELIAVSVGRTRAVQIGGEPVETAYLKSPLALPCSVGRNGLDGNETAVHPDPVYAIAEEHYAYWAETLGVAPGQWPHGYFAENLTIRGLSERHLHVGDIVQIGPRLRLIVAGPRIPCFKLAWRMEQPDSFVRDFASSGRTGVYFGVLEPGAVAAGDSVRVIHQESSNPTVYEIGACTRGEHSLTAEELERILALPSLSKTSALLLSGAYYRLLDAPDLDRHWADWRPFVVHDLVDETDSVRSFVLRPVDAGPLPRFAAGQFVPVRFRTTSGEEFVRPWSLSTYSRSPTAYRISVKREPRRGASEALHVSLRRGDLIELRPPAGDFNLDRARVMPVVLLAAGIGITPLLAMLEAHLDRGPAAAPIRLFHCVRSPAAHPFREEIEALASGHSNLRAEFFYSRAAEHEVPAPHRAGRLDAAQLLEAIRDLSIEFAGKSVSVPWYEVDYYLCGPRAFCEDIGRALISKGAAPERVHAESFVIDARPGFGPQLDEAQIVFRKSGRSTMWRSSDSGTILEAARLLGLDLPFSCRTGFCQTCACRVIEGTVQYEFAPASRPRTGYALPCCARPGSAVLVLDA